MSRGVSVHELGLPEVWRNQAPLRRTRRSSQQGFIRIFCHVNEAHHSMRHIVAAARKALNKFEEPGEFAFKILIGVLCKIVGGRLLDLDQAVVKIGSRAVGIVSRLVEHGFTAECGIKVRQARFDIFPCNERPADCLVKNAAGAVSLLGERWGVPWFRHD